MVEYIDVAFQVASKTRSEWMTTSVILNEGELAYENDTGMVKVGDGQSRYSELKYLQGPQGPAGERGQGVHMATSNYSYTDETLSALTIKGVNSNFTVNEDIPPHIIKGSTIIVSVTNNSNKGRIEWLVYEVNQIHSIREFDGIYVGKIESGRDGEKGDASSIVSKNKKDGVTTLRFNDGTEVEIEDGKGGVTEEDIKKIRKISYTKYVYRYYEHDLINELAYNMNMDVKYYYDDASILTYPHYQPGNMVILEISEGYTNPSPDTMVGVALCEIMEKSGNLNRYWGDAYLTLRPVLIVNYNFIRNYGQ